MFMGQRRRIPRAATLVAALALAAVLPAGAASPVRVTSHPLQDYMLVRELMSEGRYDRALEIARQLADQQDSGLFRELPQQVQAERIVSTGDARTALALYQALTPPGCCRVAHLPWRWGRR